jgi:hypothetical protein
MTLCRDAFTRHPESIVGLAGGATCETPVTGPGWLCDMHAAASHALLSTPITDVLDESEVRARKAAEAMDPAIVALIGEARTFLTTYAGSHPFLRDLLADRRYGTKHFRVTEKMARAILAVRDREAAVAAKAEATMPRLAEAVDWVVGRQATDAFAASLAEGMARWGSLTQNQYDAVLRNIDRAAPAATPAGEGWYRLDGRVYKVQKAVHGSGHLYAKRLDVPADIRPGSVKGEWVYAPGMVNRLTDADRLTVDEAAAMGRLYGMCMVCGKTLTDEDSIEAGIGPVCIKRLR